MKKITSSWITEDKVKCTTSTHDGIKVFESEFIGTEEEAKLFINTAESSVKSSVPRGDRAARMLTLIVAGTDKATVKSTLLSEGYIFNPTSVFHSEFARLSKKAGK